MAQLQRIVPCLWFDDQAEQAARFYTGIFPRSEIRSVTHYGKAGQEQHRQPEGKVLTVEFELDGQLLTALNGGPVFKFNEAVSLQVMCDTQDEIDHYWERLGEGGDPRARQCGWLKDRYGLSWQVAPAMARTWLANSPNPASERFMLAMMAMQKLDIAALQAAYDGR
jgi:predicted 3-demethylubiquinone-9 3-methyltransferase (glyoxalase superfamily)